jgi:hypothetical protein
MIHSGGQNLGAPPRFTIPDVNFLHLRGVALRCNDVRSRAARSIPLDLLTNLESARTV